MINIQPGSYRVPLATGLTALGEDALAEKVKNKIVNLSFICSMQGSVDVDKKLVPVFIKALKLAFVKNAVNANIVPHYITALERGVATIVEEINK